MHLSSNGEIVDLLANKIEDDFNYFRKNLHLVNFRGEFQNLPVKDVEVGDAVIMKCGLYICYEAEYESQPKWKRLLTDSDLDNFYTKEEIDLLYLEKTPALKEFIEAKREDILSTIYENFVTKEDIDSRLSGLQDYIAEIERLQTWQAEQQQLIDEYHESTDAALAEFEEIKASWEAALDNWISEQESSLSAKITEFEEYAEEAKDRLSKTDDLLGKLIADCYELSGAYVRAKKGKQKVVGEGYEA